MLHISSSVVCYVLFCSEAISEETPKTTGNFSFLYIGVLCISYGILFSVVKNIHFDVEHNKMKEQYQVGPIKIGE